MSELWERFAAPPRAHWPTPLWWWSGDRLDPARLRWQMERLVAGGARNLVIMNLAPTSPLYGSDADDPPFLSERWWELFERVCADAEELGAGLWLYDQIGFSGANLQGEVVRAMPEAAGLVIERVALDVDGAGALRCPAGGAPVAAAALPRGGAPVEVPLRDGCAEWTGRGRLMLFYTVERGFDYFSGAACRRLLGMVHGTFEARVPHRLGSVIVGSFQDELPLLPTWSATFATDYERIAGYDPVPRLAGLWEDLGAESEQLRRDFHVVRGRLAEDAFFRPLHEWHERHGMLCSFDQQDGARQGEPIEATRLYGDYLRTHRWFSVPGSDHHGDAKIHSSLAHAYGHEHVWIESFHSSGWGGTLEETFDWLLPWIGAGATIYDPHATYYSTRRGWWEWAPPATDWRQPYWRHYPELARAVARLTATLSWGSHVCDVAVLFPSATVQAGLGQDGPTDAAAAAAAIYERIAGRMKWYAPRPGVLGELARDFDVVDDDTVAAARVASGSLVHHGERYGALVLPGCAVLEAATAARLVELVDAGGALVAVGALPARAVGGDGAAVAALRERFARGAARHVAAPEDLAAALAGVPRTVAADVPTLCRRDGDSTVVFVPAAFPRATATEVPFDDPALEHPWLHVAIDFDAERYASEREVTVAGVSGAPELWEPFSGRRRRLPAVAAEDGVTVRVPFTDGPAALLVWDGAPVDAEPAGEEAPATALELDGPWTVEIEPVLADEWGDLDAAPRDLPVQAWTLEHAVGAAWTPVHATFGPRGTWTGPGATGDRRSVWSPSRGIHKDPVHLPTLGPCGRVPEEFLRFGRVQSGDTVRFRTVLHAAEPLATHLVVGAAAAKQAWLDGSPVALDGPGYLAAAPVRLAAGATVLELAFEAGEPVDLRAHFALVADLDGYRRPEWLRAAGAASRDSVVAFCRTLQLDADPLEAHILVGANGPCRVLVDGREIGRQGGFDPYLERDVDRLQPYDVSAHLRAGAQELRLELLDLGRTRPAALLDGVVRTANGPTNLMSVTDWTATRDGVTTALELRRDQGGDPAHNHIWRRPHPLPAGAWLEPGRAVADAGGAVDVRAGTAVEPQRLRLRTPPGAERAVVPLAPGCRLGAATLDGEPVACDEASIPLPHGDRPPRTLELTIDPAPGLSGGAVLSGPVGFAVSAGTMELGDWQERGLESHSGGVRYRRRLAALPDGDTRLYLDLGMVRGTAEVRLDGEPAGVRVCAPYVFELPGDVRPGAELEVLVLNTLAPHLDAVSPTHYVFEGQKRSGLFGPVALRRGALAVATGAVT